MPRNSFTLLTLVPVTIPLSVKANAGKPAEASNAEPSVTMQIASAAIKSPEPTPGRLNHLFALSILSIADSSISFRGARSAAADHAQFHVKQSPQRRGDRIRTRLSQAIPNTFSGKRQIPQHSPTLAPREQPPLTLDILPAARTFFYRPIFIARGITPCAELSRLR